MIIIRSADQKKLSGECAISPRRCSFIVYFEKRLGKILRCHRAGFDKDLSEALKPVFLKFKCQIKFFLRYVPLTDQKAAGKFTRLSSILLKGPLQHLTGDQFLVKQDIPEAGIGLPLQPQRLGQLFSLEQILIQQQLPKPLLIRTSLLVQALIPALD